MEQEPENPMKHIEPDEPGLPGEFARVWNETGNGRIRNSGGNSRS
jgi:hypothetical protein